MQWKWNEKKSGKSLAQASSHPQSFPTKMQRSKTFRRDEFLTFFFFFLTIKLLASENPKTSNWSTAKLTWNKVEPTNYRKRGSASYIVREVLSVRERERERDTERETEVTSPLSRSNWRWIYTSLAKNSHNWRWAYAFPCQNFALFVSPFIPVSPFAERSPWWRWNSQWVHTFHCQKFFRPQALFPLFQMARAARRVIENPRQMIKSCPVLFFFPSKNWIKLIPKTIGNRKRDCAWGGSGW